MYLYICKLISGVTTFSVKEMSLSNKANEQYENLSKLLDTTINHNMNTLGDFHIRFYNSSVK